MSSPATPYLRIDVQRLQANVDQAAAAAARAGVTVRPHAKTHKSIDIARRQLAAGAVGLTVATVGEAEAFASHGATDLFIAYPLWLTDALAGRLRALAATARLAIGVDSVAGAETAGRLLAGSGVEVLVEVDSGHHRSGIDPADAGTVAAAAAASGLVVRGVFTFPGHSYAPEGREAAARDEATALAAARASVEAVGIEVRVVSGGSTPSLEHADASVLTEVRPGVYVFGDAQQWELGSTTPDRIALTATATVVSHANGRAVLDAGSKVLAADRAPYATGFGRLLDHPDARIGMLSEHHAVVDMGPAALPPLGSVVSVVPNHCCTAVNLVDELWADDGQSLTPWPVVARGRNG